MFFMKHLYIEHAFFIKK